MVEVWKDTMTRRELMGLLGLRDEKNFRERYLNAAIAIGLVERSAPGSPNSRFQRYRLTAAGKSLRMKHDGSKS